MYYVSRIAGVVAVAGLAAAAWCSILLFRADAQFRKGTPEGVARAVELTPRNTEYLSLRAIQIEYDGGDAGPVWERMARLDPLSSAPRLRLGLNAETRGDLESAERWLLDAARVDRQFEPRWTLANFYYRQQRPADFWMWMRLALERSYGDRRPAFDLCWRAAGDPADILTLALPQRHEILAAYLEYLLNQKDDRRHREAAGPVALKLASWHEPADRTRLRTAMDVLLDSGNGAAAWAVWQVVTPGSSPPDLGTSTPGYAFDWRTIPSPGITHIGQESPASHRIVFSGEQPQSCELLRRWVGLHARRRYRLEWEARTSGFPASTGLEWRIAGERFPVPSNEQWTPGRVEFTASSDWDVLSLTYERPLGQTRAAGYIELRHVAVAEAQP